MQALHLLMGKILHSRKGRLRAWMGTLGLGIAALLLLVAVQMQSDFSELLQGKQNKDTNTQYLVINRQLNNNNLNSGGLREEELEALKKLPEVSAVGIIQPGYFKASLSSTSDRFPFYTDVSFETVSSDFLDEIPEHWTWQEKDEYVPIIVPSLYLDLYNFQFALAQQLPQLTPEVVKMIFFNIRIQGPNGEVVLKGKVAGFSDRIQSMLVPQEFMQWCNARFAQGEKRNPSRILIKTKDATSPVLNQFLEKNQLQADKEKTRFSKYREIVNWIAGISGLSGLLMLVFAALVLSLFIQLNIVSKQDEIRLLIQLGASPQQMIGFLMKKFFPPNAIIVLIALGLVAILQYLLFGWLQKKAIGVSAWISPLTLLAALLLILLMGVVNRIAIGRSVKENPTR
jgi:ABC-type antimicrobial peptide transport system permease subunit